MFILLYFYYITIEIKLKSKLTSSIFICISRFSCREKLQNEQNISVEVGETSLSLLTFNYWALFAAGSGNLPRPFYRNGWFWADEIRGWKNRNDRHLSLSVTVQIPQQTSSTFSAQKYFVWSPSIRVKPEEMSVLLPLRIIEK